MLYSLDSSTCTVQIETHARQGLWMFDIHFQTNDTFYRVASPVLSVL